MNRLVALLVLLVVLVVSGPALAATGVVCSGQAPQDWTCEESFVTDSDNLSFSYGFHGFISGALSAIVTSDTGAGVLDCIITVTAGVCRFGGFGHFEAGQVVTLNVKVVGVGGWEVRISGT